VDEDSSSTLDRAMARHQNCRRLLRWQPAVALLGLTVLGLLPPLATGHSSSAVRRT